MRVSERKVKRLSGGFAYRGAVTYPVSTETAVLTTSQQWFAVDFGKTSFVRRAISSQAATDALVDLSSLAKSVRSAEQPIVRRHA